MQTIKINLFCVNELSDNAKEKAHQDYISSEYFEYSWLNESIESVKAFCNAFNCDLTDYELSTYSNGYLKSNINNECIRGMKKKDLPNKESMPTGYYLDSDLMYSFYENYQGDIIEAFNIALNDGLKLITKDMEYQESLEYFIEHAEVNQYQYTEDGNFY
jgi:hypothetical protein